MAAAERDVAVVAAYLGLSARSDGVAALVDAKVHRRLASAFADGLELDHRVRKREEGGGAGEELALKVGAETVAEDRDAEAVGDLAQLEHVALRQELGFVDEHAVDLALLELLADRGEQVDAFVVTVRRRG